MAEENLHEISTGSTSHDVVSDCVRAESCVDQHSIFELLDPETRKWVIVLTYVAFTALSLYTAVRCLDQEFYSQINHIPFDMKQWMYAVIFLPVCGLSWNAIKHWLPGGKCIKCNASKG